jgi:hypothetical protein
MKSTFMLMGMRIGLSTINYTMKRGQRLHTDGFKAWYLDNLWYPESEYKEEMERRNNTCDGKTVTIDGKEYILTEVV